MNTAQQQTRILIVDDEPWNLKLLGSMLRNDGYEALFAQDGAEALEKTLTQSPDLILMDAMMPKLNGFDVVRQLKKDEKTQHIPVIMLTVLDDMDNRLKGLEAGAEGYLTKPINNDELRITIRNFLRFKQSQDQLYRHRKLLDETERRLRASNERLRLIMEASHDGLWDWDLIENKLYLSSRWFEQIGLTQASMAGAPGIWFHYVHPQDREKLQAAIQAHLSGQTKSFTCEYRMRHQAGHICWMQARGCAQFDSDGKAIRFAGSQTDISKQRKYDPLTGLPNRELFQELLESAWVRSHRRKEHHFALLHVDLDRFRRINEELGSDAGDELLQIVAQRLQKEVRDGDLVCRLGIDEFAVLLDDLHQPSDAHPITKRIQASLAQPIKVNGQEVLLQTSIGLHLAPDKSPNTQTFLKETSRALKIAKQQLGNSVATFQSEQSDSKNPPSLQREAELFHALEQEQFCVFYHPIVSLKDGRLSGFEALARWAHPERGILHPGHFIEQAEHTGLIHELGRQIRTQVACQLQAWRASFPTASNLYVSVNLATPEFLQSSLLDELETLLKQYQLPPEALRLEMTESILMKNSSTATNTIKRLKELGFLLYLDDFGTGFSSLSYLQRFPIHTLKIDRSFIHDMHTNEQNLVLARTIVAMAHSLNLSVTAEGIEEKEHQALLREMGCECAQGFLYARPLPAEDATTLLEKEWRAPGFEKE